MLELAAGYRALAVDFGTGDGAYVRRLAAGDPSRLVIGVDANADNLREVSRKAAGRPARGGLPNARFGRLALADAPGDLAGLADALTVLLPWGSLLAAVVRGREAGFDRLRALCKPGAALEVVFGYGGDSERAAIAELGLPLPEALSPADLGARYADAGFSVTAHPLTVDGLTTVPTTWARKLAFSGRDRRFWRISGRSQ